MKWLTAVFGLLLALVSVAPAFADLEWADPALCVNGKWLLIDAAATSAIQVRVPQDAAYGDQAAGHCRTAAPAPLLPLSSVKAKGHGDTMTVVVDGSDASPVVTVSYGMRSETRRNHGREMRFEFQLGHGR
jgi:hypothetical protein